MTRLTTVFQGTNAELMAHVHQLYPFEGKLLDPTWGEGGWWTEITPKPMVRHDLFTLDGVDFRKLPHRKASFQRAVFDPAYVSTGGRKGKTPKSAKIKKGMAKAYGMHSTESTPKKQWDLVIVPGLFELTRVLAPDGLLYVKCQDYVSSGKKWWCVNAMHNFLQAADYSILDQVIHFTGTGPQPLKNINGSDRNQKHLHAAHSVLFVARRARFEYDPKDIWWRAHVRKAGSLHSQR